LIAAAVLRYTRPPILVYTPTPVSPRRLEGLD